MKKLIASCALAAAAMNAGGCAKDFARDPHVALLNAEHLGNTLADIRAENRAQSDLLKRYYRDDAARRHLNLDRQYEWVAAEYEARGARMTPAESLAFARAYFKDKEQVQALLGEQYQNIKDLEFLGDNNIANVREFMRAQSRQSEAQARVQTYEASALRQFAQETREAIREAHVARQMERQKEEAAPPEEVFEPEHHEPPLPAEIPEPDTSAALRLTF